MYVVIQKGFVIFGTGKTQEEAVDDMKQWIDKDNPCQNWTVEDFPKDVSRVNIGELFLVKATPELVSKVKKESGDIVYDIRNNTATLDRG
tara:strand:+ start:506 stop:775 length:270 start_codon:yes stop_codon:yes gene_type:complete